MIEICKATHEKKFPLTKKELKIDPLVEFRPDDKSGYGEDVDIDARAQIRQSIDRYKTTNSIGLKNLATKFCNPLTQKDEKEYEKINKELGKEEYERINKKIDEIKKNALAYQTLVEEGNMSVFEPEPIDDTNLNKNTDFDRPEVRPFRSVDGEEGEEEMIVEKKDEKEGEEVEAEAEVEAQA